MKIPQTNLRILSKAKNKPRAGDVFAFQVDPIPNLFFFGSVISTDTKIGGIADGGGVLIYLYRTTSADKTIIPSLRTSELLLPPIGTNAIPWTKGYFETVARNAEVEALPQHCFRDARGWFFDEFGNRLPNSIQPVGVYGLSGIGSIDTKISKALGIDLKA